MANVNQQRLKNLLLELVQIDSLSRKERDVAERLRREIESLGAVCRFDRAGERVGGNTGNLIGRIGGTKPGLAPLLLCAHMDTVVPGEGVKPIVEGDIIRTDGTTVLGGDDKSGCAVICETLHQIHEQRIPHGPIDVVFTICEEVGLLGAKNLELDLFEAREGLVFDSDSPGLLFVRAPGAQTLSFTVRGYEAHAGMVPERGISAIKVAADAIAAMRLGRIDDETTANLGFIQGGRAINIVPNEVVIRGEARSRSAEKLSAQVTHMIDCFKQAVARATIMIDGKQVAATFDYSADSQYQAMNIPEDAPIVRKVIEAARRTGRAVNTAATGGGCDANIFNQRGLTVANLGTGMRDIHTVREWLDIKDMVATAEVTVELLKLHAGG
ncbi:MAG TPA: M20/M25/M40 family metallo-hydrolase [Candidatus Binataceae bacterium]|nr:M20/M25/M40 family metallo-hydrolase [Candidatus Binataceae bacterium]